MKRFGMPSLLLAAMISGCFHGSSNDGASTIETENLSLGTAAKNVQLMAGVPIQHKFTYSYPGDATARGDFSINLTKTLESISLSSTPVAGTFNRFESLRLLASALVKEAFAAEAAQVTVYISHAGDPNVCSSPYFAGPNTVFGAVGSAPTTSKSTASFGGAVVDIINSGSFDLCVVTTPPFDAYVTVPDIVVDFKACEPSTADIVGIWSGTYQCDNYGMADEGGAVQLNISSNVDGSYSYVDTSGAQYDGHLCGNKFKFKGGSTGLYSESGTLTVNGNSATKTSNWHSTNGSTGGRCSDTLQKVGG